MEVLRGASNARAENRAESGGGYVVGSSPSWFNFGMAIRALNDVHVHCIIHMRMHRHIRMSRWTWTPAHTHDPIRSEAKAPHAATPLATSTSESRRERLFIQ